ncbi:MAG: hypothetical protein KatS3mg014_1544 [Actinomycetota bacterium]|nr:MAG: hypothetical protein KatS3mg014_1544 [Actinomycetota bacterium]
MDGWRRLARLAMLAGLALLLTGCLKLDIDLRIQPDDTVDGAVVFAVAKDLVELGGGSFEDIVQETPFPSDVEGVRVEEYDDGDFVGQRYVFDGVALEMFAASPDPDSLRIVREGDTFRVSGALDLAGPTGVTGPDPAALFSSAEIRVAITFPGEVISSNGKVEGTTVVWEPKFGERLEIQATGSAIPSGGGFGAMTVALLVVGVVALAAIAALVVTSRRRAAPVAAQAGEGDALALAPSAEAPAGGDAPPTATPPPGEETPPPPPPPAP